MKSVSVRLTNHRVRRNLDRPELAALLKKYDCTHAVLTAAMGKAKADLCPAMFIDEHGLFQYTTNTGNDASRAAPIGRRFINSGLNPKSNFEFEKIKIDSVAHGKLVAAALGGDLKNIAAVFAEIVSDAALAAMPPMSTATH